MVVINIKSLTKMHCKGECYLNAIFANVLMENPLLAVSKQTADCQFCSISRWAADDHQGLGQNMVKDIALGE